MLNHIVSSRKKGLHYSTLANLGEYECAGEPESVMCEMGVRGSGRGSGNRGVRSEVGVRGSGSGSGDRG